jgi:hypothetical protein
MGKSEPAARSGGVVLAKRVSGRTLEPHDRQAPAAAVKADFEHEPRAWLALDDRPRPRT